MSTFDDIEKEAHEMMRFALVAVGLQVLVYLAVLGFVGWIIVKVLQHFGIV